MENKSTAVFESIVSIFCITLFGFMLGYALAYYHYHNPVCSSCEQTQISVKSFIASQPDIAINMVEKTINLPGGSDEVK